MSKYMDEKTMFLSPKVSQYGSHMVMSNVIKDTKTSILNIDTKYSDDYTTNLTSTSLPTYNVSSYVFTLPQRVNDVKSMTVYSVEIPNTIHNISASQGNNYFKVTCGGVAKMITLVDGYYTPSSLVDEINYQLTVQFPSAKISYGSNIANTNTIPTVNGVNISFFYTRNTVATIDFAVTPDGSFDKYNFKMKLGWILGFRNTTYVIPGVVTDSIFTSWIGSTLTYSQLDASSNIIPLVTSQTSYFVVSENYMNLITSKYFYLVIDEHSNGFQNSFVSPLSNSLINKNIIAKIAFYPALSPFGTIISGNQSNGVLISTRRIYNGKVDLQRLVIQLVNENGQIISLNGFDFSFSLLLEHE